MQTIRIDDREIGPGQPAFVIAEAGINHNGSLERALEMVRVAAEAGADAIKFQTYRTDQLLSADAPKADYQVEATGGDESQHEMLQRCELGEAAHRELLAACEERGVLFMSTPFEEGSADLLDALGVKLFKIPSGEITNLPFLRHVASKGKPLIVSTGMATLEEVREAVGAIGDAGHRDVVLLHCLSDYPADPAEVNLRAMDTLREAFGVPVGYSDHTLGNEIALAAVARGACAIEKHFTLDRSLPGPDHPASLEPGELMAMVAGIRKVESSLGHGRKEPAPSEMNTAAVARKSLVAAKDLSAGHVLRKEDLEARRPGTGISPAQIDRLVGHELKVAVKAGEMLRMEMLEE